MTHARAKITNEWRLTPRECPHCRRWMDEEFLKKRLKEVQALKSARMKEAHRLNGTHIGRPRRIKIEDVLELRDAGLTLRQIANRLNCSTSPIVYALKMGRSEPTATEET